MKEEPIGFDEAVIEFRNSMSNMIRFIATDNMSFDDQINGYQAMFSDEGLSFDVMEMERSIAELDSLESNRRMIFDQTMVSADAAILKGLAQIKVQASTIATQAEKIVSVSDGRSHSIPIVAKNAFNRAMNSLADVKRAIVAEASDLGQFKPSKPSNSIDINIGKMTDGNQFPVSPKLEANKVREFDFSFLNDLHAAQRDAQEDKHKNDRPGFKFSMG